MSILNWNDAEDAWELVCNGTANIADGEKEKLVAFYTSFIKQDNPSSPKGMELMSKRRETAILKIPLLILKDQTQSNTGILNSLGQFIIEDCKTVWSKIPRAKCARLLKELLDYFQSPTLHPSPSPTAPETLEANRKELEVCQALLSWSKEDNRTYLRKSLELRLAALLLRNRMFSESLVLIKSLTSEFKKMEDTINVVEVALLECKLYYCIKNLPKSRSALTAARGAANSIYCPPALQSQLDLQAGLVHGEEGDWKTAYGYFVEALDGITGSSSFGRAGRAGSKNDSLPPAEKTSYLEMIKLILLSKLMLGQGGEAEVEGFLSSKMFQRPALMGIAEGDSVIISLAKIGDSYRLKDLLSFNASLMEWDHSNDGECEIYVLKNLKSLYDSLLEGNLLKICLPYKAMKMEWICSKIGLSIEEVEQKLSVMILDSKLFAHIDQSTCSLTIDEEKQYDSNLSSSIEGIKVMNECVEHLYLKAMKSL